MTIDRDEALISPLERLSAREMQVLKLVVEGRSSKEIARVLGVLPTTVDTYRSRLMKKLGVTNVVALVRLAIANHSDLLHPIADSSASLALRRRRPG